MGTGVRLSQPRVTHRIQDNWKIKIKKCKHNGKKYEGGKNLRGRQKCLSIKTKGDSPDERYLYNENCKCKQNYKGKKIWGGQKCLASTILNKVVSSPDAESRNI